MKITMLGSGGYLRIPRAICQCNICVEARKRGYPYKRLGPAIFIEDEKILFDTPEDINEEINEVNIRDIKYVFYSHWHPDHTAGCRIFEVIKNTIDNVSPDDNKRNPIKNPILVHLTEKLYADFKERVPILFYLESCGFVKIVIIKDKVKIGNLTITPIPLENGFVFAYLIEEKGKKVLYCADHCKHMPILKELKDLELLIMNLGFFTDNIKGYKKLPSSHKLYNDTGFVKDNLRIIKELKPKKTVLHHIEESWNRGYDDYEELMKKHSSYNIEFAFDRMKIEL